MGKFVDVTLRLIDQMTGPLNHMGQALERQRSQLTRAGRQIQNAGKSIYNVGSSLTKKFTVPIVGAGAAAIKLASDFENGMSKVSSISGATGEQLDKLSQKAKEMGAKTKFSATQAAEAYSYMAMAGWKAGDMLNGIEPIMKLAGASGEDLATTSDIVTDALTAFGKTAKDTAMFADVLATTSANANTNVAMMGESFKYVGPVAGALKYSIQDVSLALGMMGNSGVKASSAGTSLRSWMTNMSKPTNAVSTAMQELGISMTDAQGKMKPLRTLIGDTREAFNKLTEKQKSQYAAALAGKTGMAGLLAIVNSSEKDFTKLAGAIDNSTGAANKMYDVANNNLQGQLTILKSTVESLGIAFGERLVPYVKRGTSWLQSIADKSNELNDTQKDMIIRVGLVVAAIGPALLIFGKTVTVVGGMVRALGTLGRMFHTFGSLAGIVASPAGVVIAVLAAIALATILVIKNWNKIKPVCMKIKSVLVDTFGSSVQEGMKFFVSQGKAIMKELAPAFEAVKRLAIDLAPIIKATLGDAFKFLAAIMLKLTPAIKFVAKAYVSYVKLVVTAISAYIRAEIRLATIVINCFDAILNKSKQFSKYIKLYFSLLVNTARVQLTYIYSVTTSIFGNWVDFFKNTFDAVKQVFNGLTQFVSGIFTGNWKKAWEGVKNIFGGIFKGLAGMVKLQFNNVISVINSAIDGINSISVDVPKGVPKVGGQHIGFSVGHIPALAKGTNDWQGGIVQVHERGGEIIDLPKGSRVYPHDRSVQKAYSDGAKSSGKVIINIPKLADKIVIREDADIDKIVTKLANKLEKKSENLGGGQIGYVH